MKQCSAAMYPVLVLFSAYLLICSWGFYAHKKINNLAVFTLPPEMLAFYKKNIDYITHHAVDADKRRKFEGEAERHYIDVDRYGSFPFDSLPRRWEDAVLKYGEDTLRRHGIVPWQVLKMLRQLTLAFENRETGRILSLSADLGHYISDAHVPLHTTFNYDGQFTGQKGIHGLWESRIPELSCDSYSFITGKAQYIQLPSEAIWNVIKHSFAAKDSVFLFDAELTREFPPDKKYTYEGKKKVYSSGYAREYEKRLNGMVERRMREAVKTIGSFWYTAWVNAGQPDLSGFPEAKPEDKEAEDKKLLRRTREHE